MVRLQLRRGPDERALLGENTTDLSEEWLRMANMLKDLMAKYQVYAPICKWQVHSIECDEFAIGPRSLQYFGRTFDIDAYPACGRGVRPEEIYGPAIATTEV
jgi:hypothetical protein